MIQVVSELGLTCIVSHLPEKYGIDIQAAHQDRQMDSADQVQEELLSKVGKLINAGIHKDQIILDPGIGFGKTPDLNRELLQFASRVPDYGVMIGYSNKRFLGEKRLEIETNLQAGRIAVAAGAKFLRVHDVVGHQVLTKTT
jgi:dihydropteroate synthase